jgi:hypothetical protein
MGPEIAAALSGTVVGKREHPPFFASFFDGCPLFSFQAQFPCDVATSAVPMKGTVQVKPVKVYVSPISSVGI